MISQTISKSTWREIIFILDAALIKQKISNGGTVPTALELLKKQFYEKIFPINETRATPCLYPIYTEQVETDNKQPLVFIELPDCEENSSSGISRKTNPRVAVYKLLLRGQLRAYAVEACDAKNEGFFKEAPCVSANDFYAELVVRTNLAFKLQLEMCFSEGLAERGETDPSFSMLDALLRLPGDPLKSKKNDKEGTGNLMTSTPAKGGQKLISAIRAILSEKIDKEVSECPCLDSADVSRFLLYLNKTGVDAKVMRMCMPQKANVAPIEQGVGIEILGVIKISLRLLGLTVPRRSQTSLDENYVYYPVNLVFGSNKKFLGYNLWQSSAKEEIKKSLVLDDAILAGVIRSMIEEAKQKMTQNTAVFTNGFDSFKSKKGPLKTLPGSVQEPDAATSGLHRKRKPA